MPSAVSVAALHMVWPFAALCVDDHRSLFARPPFLSHLIWHNDLLFCIFTTLLSCYAIRTFEYVIDVIVLYVFCDKIVSLFYVCLLENKKGWSCHAARRGGKPSVPHRALHGAVIERRVPAQAA